MNNNQKYFQEKELSIENNKLRYYLSPILVKNNFRHGFFTKRSSEIEFNVLTNRLNHNENCVLKQMHSNKIVFGSKTTLKKRIEADGIFCDKDKQNLWIYTADCMPILFADRTKRFVAAIHCGRKGLENKIIKNIIKIFNNLGTLREDLLVAIGPSISKKNYLIDKKTFQEFHKKVQNADLGSSADPYHGDDLNNLAKFKNKPSISLDLKKIAYIQLLNENVPSDNIEVSSICTYDSDVDFYSWRRSKTPSRQWSFISTR